MLKKLLASFLVVGLFAMSSVSLAFDVSIVLMDETGAAVCHWESK